MRSSCLQGLLALSLSGIGSKASWPLMDRAGWHCANDLVVPANLTPVFLPPYSPELNSIERLWLYLKERFLSHRLWPDHDTIVDAVCRAWQRVTAETGRIKSRCQMEWAQAVNN
jgi:hypothetical protein